VQRYFFNEGERMHESDQSYITRRRRLQEAARTESPENRLRKLEASFSKHRVQMVRTSRSFATVYNNVATRLRYHE